MNDVLMALWLFLPAGVANAAPVIANKTPLLNRWTTPMDFHQTYKGKRIFGDNKTWRGVVFAIVLAALTGSLQALLIHRELSEVYLGCLIGGLLGFGAMYGDAAASFFKRQSGIASGESWFPVDQIDYIIGGLLAVAPLALFSWLEMLVILIVYTGLHLVVAYIAYLLKLKDKPI